MKKKERKSLLEKLVVAVTKVVKDNNTRLTDKVENMIGKPIRQIIKKENKKVLEVKKP